MIKILFLFLEKIGFWCSWRPSQKMDRFLKVLRQKEWCLAVDVETHGWAESEPDFAKQEREMERVACAANHIAGKACLKCLLNQPELQQAPPFGRSSYCFICHQQGHQRFPLWHGCQRSTCYQYLLRGRYLLPTIKVVKRKGATAMTSISCTCDMFTTQTLLSPSLDGVSIDCGC